MTERPYMQEPWYALLMSRCAGGVTRTLIAKQLGLSSTTLSMVINGTGPYGDGRASTAKFADRVVHTFGRYACPHLTEQAGESRVITAEECRAFAHCEPPTGRPRAMQHWQACRKCPHAAASAPPIERAPAPRKVIPIQPQEASDVAF